jgi:hypothetical protein
LAWLKQQSFNGGQSMSLEKYRASSLEQARTEDILRLIPSSGNIALDMGARDGHFSKLLAEKFNSVVALDLEVPSIKHSRIRCVKGDVLSLNFDDAYFDFVFCAEVLEHIPPLALKKACLELARVSKDYLLIGVPYKQDIRVGRTTCYSCGGKNPPWGHVNTFDENRLKQLFPQYGIEKISFVGKSNATTNLLSTFLMDLAGNPYGTYDQDEPCIHCGKKLVPPPNRTLFKKVITKSAFYAKKLSYCTHSNWIHVLFRKIK